MSVASGRFWLEEDSTIGPPSWLKSKDEFCEAKLTEILVDFLPCQLRKVWYVQSLCGSPVHIKIMYIYV